MHFEMNGIRSTEAKRDMSKMLGEQMSLSSCSFQSSRCSGINLKPEMKSSLALFMLWWNQVQSGFVYFFDTDVPAFTTGSGFFHITQKVPDYSGPFQPPPFPLPRYGCFNELKQLVFCDPPSPPKAESRDEEPDEAYDYDNDYSYIIPRIQGETNNLLQPKKQPDEETLVEQLDMDIIV